MPIRSAARRLLAAAILSLLPAAPVAAQFYIHSDERRDRLQKLIEQYQPLDSRDADDQLNAFTLLSDLAISVTAEMERERIGWPQNETDPLFALADGDNPTPSRLRRAERMLRLLKDRNYFARLNHLAQVPRAVRPVVTREREAELRANYRTHDLIRCRPLSLAAEAQMVSAARLGDSASTTAAYRGGLAIGRIFAHQLTTLDAVLGYSFVQSANKQLRGLIIEGILTEPALLECAAAIDEQTGGLPPLIATVQAERITAWESFGKLDENGRPALSEEDSALLDRILDAYAVIATFPVPERRTAAAAIAAQTSLDAIPRKPDFQFSAASAADIADSALRVEAAMLTDIAATRIMIALERCKLREGAYPEALALLVPNYLDSLVPARGESYPLIYQRKGNAYRLYTPGYDLTDNGAMPHPDQPDIAFRDVGAGFDFVYR